MTPSLPFTYSVREVTEQAESYATSGANPIDLAKDLVRSGCARRGHQKFHWHDLRRRYASSLRQTGTPLGNIAELLGHKGLAMSRGYAHLSISNLHEAVARIANSAPSSTGAHAGDSPGQLCQLSS